MLTVSLLLIRYLIQPDRKEQANGQAVTALDLGIPLTLIGEAVFSRCLSAIKDERVKASRILQDLNQSLKAKTTDFINDLKDALYASKIVSYAQGYSLMKAAAGEYRLESELWRHCSYVARRLYYQVGIPRIK